DCTLLSTSSCARAQLTVSGVRSTVKASPYPLSPYQYCFPIFFCGYDMY
ncbi:unnamed protein product, partial [Laminaria digitata]